ncbi:Transmembrane protein 55A [Chelonia mydas]|uniref:Phosphatidylinositol-4,5-bisphosphate 4-phosphatase n=1 Tax=Chelonia mydas TaxID=8469 RepID=M7BYG5_CHEMY|nr:Transmembrane protein 55A [Chelonia mydas]
MGWLPLPTAPIGLPWRTAASGSHDWLNLRTQQNDPDHPVGLVIELFHHFFAAELPPPYTAIASPDASGVPVINCRVCQSLINLDGKLHQHVVKCTVCNEATPIKNPPSGKKYVRCPCNCLLICKDTSRRIGCPRPNCRRIINLGPVMLIPEEQPAQPALPVQPEGTRVVCGHCGNTFLWMELRFNTLAKCPHCKKMLGYVPGPVLLLVFDVPLVMDKDVLFSHQTFEYFGDIHDQLSTSSLEQKLSAIWEPQELQYCPKSGMPEMGFYLTTHAVGLSELEMYPMQSSVLNPSPVYTSIPVPQERNNRGGKGKENKGPGDTQQQGGF